MESSVGGGEEVRTLGLWLCPPCVLAMPGLEKGRGWRELEEECFCSKEKKWFEIKNERKRGEGGEGLNRRLRKVKGLAQLMSIKGC